jgi:hypothetical protein
MKKISMWLGVALIGALLGVACGSKAPATTESTMPSNTGGDDTTDNGMVGGDAYGYGGDMYGGDYYGYDEGGEGDW